MIKFLLLIIFEFLDVFAMLLHFLDTATSLLLELNLVCFLDTLFSKKATNSWIFILILYLYLEMSFFMSQSFLLPLVFLIFHLMVFSIISSEFSHSSYVLPKEVADISASHTHPTSFSPEPQIQLETQTQSEPQTQSDTQIQPATQLQPEPHSVPIISSHHHSVPSSHLRKSSRVKHKPGYLQQYHCQIASHHAPSSYFMKSDSGISYSLSSSLCYDRLSPSYKTFCLQVSSTYEPQLFHQANKF
jgi:hypothetical protein